MNTDKVAAAKRARSAGDVSSPSTHNGLKLHATRPLPFALECSVLAFTNESDLIALLDVSHSMRQLVELFFAASSNLILSLDPRSARLMATASKHARRLQSLALSTELADRHQLRVNSWLCQLIMLNSVTFQRLELIKAVGSSRGLNLV